VGGGGYGASLLGGLEREIERWRAGGREGGRERWIATLQSGSG